MGGNGSWSDMNTVRKTDHKHHNQDGPSPSKGNRGKGHAKGYGKQERGKNNSYNNASRNGRHSSWENRLSRSVNRWLRYEMRTLYPENASNWVHWRAIPGAEVDFTVQQLQGVCEGDPDHLELWWENVDEANGPASQSPPGMYVRSSYRGGTLKPISDGSTLAGWRKNQIDSEGDDTSFWHIAVNVEAIAAKNKAEGLGLQKMTSSNH